METEYRNPVRRHPPSFFWPITLITVGVVWLLVNSGIIATESVYRLVPLWPMLLVLAGVSLLLDRIWWPLSALLWLAAGAFVVWALMNPPAFLPRVTVPELRHETFTEPLGSARSASVTLNLSGDPNRVYALEDSNDLFVADLNYIGEMQVDVNGSEEKNVTLDENRGTRWGIQIFNDLSDQNRPWEIGLSPRVPLRLRIDTGSGNSTFDLTGLSLESLRLETGSGDSQLTLPDGNQRFLFDYNGGSGNLNVKAPEEATFEMGLNGGSGNINIDLPDGAGVRVVVRDDGSGALRLPDGFERVGGNGDNDNNEGTWENEAYETAEFPVTIIVEDQGSGDIVIR